MSASKEFKIFLLNDNPFSLAIDQQRIKNYGYTNITAFEKSSDCINGLDHRPDVIVLDDSTEMNSGIEILKSIKRINPGIYVIIMSFSHEKTVADTALHHGAFEFIRREHDEGDRVKLVLLKILQIQNMLSKKGGTFLKKFISIL